MVSKALSATALLLLATNGFAEKLDLTFDPNAKAPEPELRLPDDWQPPPPMEDDPFYDPIEGGGDSYNPSDRANVTPVPQVVVKRMRDQLAEQWPKRPSNRIGLRVFLWIPTPEQEKQLCALQSAVDESSAKFSVSYYFAYGGVTSQHITKDRMAEDAPCSEAAMAEATIDLHAQLLRSKAGRSARPPGLFVQEPGRERYLPLAKAVETVGVMEQRYNW